MQISKLLNLNLQSIVLLILVPIITIITTIMTWLNYDEMSETILNGFNKKLTAISTTSGSFIDGDEHEKLALAKEMKSFVYDTNKDVLYGIDKKNELLKIDLNDGAGKFLMKFDFNVKDLTFNPLNGYIYASTSEGKIIFIDVDKREFDTFMRVEEEFLGLTFIAKENIFFATTKEGLFKINRKNRKIEKIMPLEAKVTSLAFDFRENAIYGVEEVNDEVIKINLENFAKSKIFFKDFPTSSTKLKGIEYFNGKLFGGEKHLMVYELLNHKSEYEEFARGYRDEKDEIYLKYIDPMREIKLKTGLTYHYTQNLIYNREDVNCFYILDVHAGNVYTPIGSEDIMDDEDLRGAENVMLRGKVYISKIKPWEQWGLLKVAFAPIMNDKGEIKAIAGADVDIGIIKQKTREAITQSLIVGIVALIIGIIASYVIAKKIIEPITKLKYGALKIAAGRYGDKVFVESPKELNELSCVFNNMSDELKNTMNNLSKYSTNTAMLRKQNELLKELSKNEFIDKDIKVHFINNNIKIDGYLKIENRVFFWFSNNNEKKELHINQKREVVKSLIISLYKYYKDNFYKEFQRIYKDDIYLFAVIDTKEKKANFYSTKLNYNLKLLTINDKEVNEIYIKNKMSINFKNQNLIFGSQKIISNFKTSKLNLFINNKTFEIRKKRFFGNGVLITVNGVHK